MKRLHIHIGVESIDKSTEFYSALFGTKPTKTKEDYAKWEIDDPYMNFAISKRSSNIGLNHLGIQVDDEPSLEKMREQLSAANISTHSDGEVTCCYAKSKKSWVEDPSGIPWETYYNMGEAQVFSNSEQSCNTNKEKNAKSCC